MVITKLIPSDSLPLTCSRSGTCCHGKNVWVNPWELALLASAKKCTVDEFRKNSCEFGGIKLAFFGEIGWKGLSACGLYDDSCGCTVHNGRPLACRLYPLGLQREGEKRYYIYQGKEFPCLEGCPEVETLPFYSVEQYMAEQKTSRFVEAQDLYLSFMESLADGAFALLIDSGLAETGDRKTLQQWRAMGVESADKLTDRIGSYWMKLLMNPDLDVDDENCKSFVADHYTIIEAEAQKSFGALQSVDAFSDASVLMMGLALHLGRSLGASPKDLSEQWISTAKEHGALE